MVNMTAVGTPTRAESEGFGVISTCCCPIQAVFMVGESLESLCDLETTSWILKAYLGSINENEVIGGRVNSCQCTNQFRQ